MRQKIVAIVCLVLFVISVTGAPALAARSFGAAKVNTATTQPTKHKKNRKKHKKHKRRHKHNRKHRKHHHKKNKPTTKPTAAPSGASVVRP